MAILNKNLRNKPKGKKVSSITKNRKSTETRYVYVSEMAALSGYNKYYIYNLPKDKLHWYKVGGERRIPLEAAVRFGSKFQNQLDRKKLAADGGAADKNFLRRA